MEVELYYSDRQTEKSKVWLKDGCLEHRALGRLWKFPVVMVPHFPTDVCRSNVFNRRLWK